MGASNGRAPLPSVNTHWTELLSKTLAASGPVFCESAGLSPSAGRVVVDITTWTEPKVAIPLRAASFLRKAIPVIHAPFGIAAARFWDSITICTLQYPPDVSIVRPSAPGVFAVPRGCTRLACANERGEARRNRSHTAAVFIQCPAFRLLNTFVLIGSDRRFRLRW